MIWSVFWSAVEACDLWHWAKRYDNPDILDGTQWEVEIAHGSRRFKSFGSNAYPGGLRDGYGYSESFMLLLQAVRKLVGGREFG